MAKQTGVGANTAATPRPAWRRWAGLMQPRHGNAVELKGGVESVGAVRRSTERAPEGLEVKAWQR